MAKSGQRYLGTLCRLGHDYDNSGKSMRSEASGLCIVCAREKSKRHYARYREIRSLQKREYRKENKDAVKCSKLRQSFGITLKEYNKILEEQNGLCAICERKCVSGKKLAVDHCHKTGKIRGLLCNACNLGIGKLGDSEESLLKALNYLRKSKKYDRL